MKKICLGLILALTAIILLSAAQAEETYSGEFENGGYWEVDEDGVMTIGGAVSSFDLEINGTELQEAITKVIIGPEVEDVNFGVFSYCYSLTEFEVDPANEYFVSQDGLVYDKAMTRVLVCPTMKDGDLALPSSVTAIGDDAFVDTHLDSLTLPDGLVSIGDQAFWGCGLPEIRFPAALEEVASNSFNNSELVRFEVDPDNAVYTAIDDAVFSKDGKILYFYPCGKIDTYDAPAGTEEIASCAFYYAKVTALTLPEGLHTLRDDALSCAEFRTVDLPASLTAIGYGAFRGCESLETVNYAGTMAQWEAVSIGGDNSPLLFRTIHCQDGDIESGPITGSIGEEGAEVNYTLETDGTLTVSGAGEWQYWAFSDNKQILRAVLEPGVTEVGWGGFNWATNMQEISIPDTVTEIKSQAFYSCNSLESIAIPASVQAIGEEAFDACDMLTEIFFEGTMDQWTAMVDREENEGAYRCTVHCSDGDIEGEGGEGDLAFDQELYEFEVAAVTTEEDDTPGATSFYRDERLFEVNVSNYGRYYDDYGENCAAWTVEQIEGPQLNFSYSSYDESCNVFLTGQEDIEGLAGQEALFRVTCEIADEASATTEVRVSFIGVETPEGITIPDVIRLSEGETRSFELAFLPEEHMLNGTDGLSMSMYIDDENQYELAEWAFDDTSVSVTGMVPGIQVCRIWVDAYDLNLTYRTQVVVEVADAQGNVPAQALELTAPEPRTLPLAPAYDGTADRASAENPVEGASIVSPETMIYTYGQMPVWSVRQLSGPEMTFELDEAAMAKDHQGRAWLRIDTVPAVPGEVVLEYTCAFGDVQATATQTLTFESVDLPTGMRLWNFGTNEAIGDTLDLDLGEHIILCGALDYNGELLLDDGDENGSLLHIDGDKRGLLNYEENMLGQRGVELWTYNPGTVTLDVSMAYQGLVIHRPLTVHITKNVDAPVPMFDQSFIFVHLDTAPLYDYDFKDTMGFARNVIIYSGRALSNAAALHAAYNADDEDYDFSPEWRLEQISGPDLELYCWGTSDGRIGLYVDQNEDLTKVNGEYLRYRLICNWMGHESGCCLELSCDPMETPEDTRIPDTITLNPGDTYEVIQGFLPEGNMLNDYELSMNAWGADENVVAMEWSDPEDETGDLTLRAVAPGITDIWYEQFARGREFRWKKMVRITVLNEDGSEPVPAVSMDVSSNHYLNMSVPLDDGTLDRVSLDPDVWVGSIGNYDLMREYNEDLPTWEVVQTGGAEIGFELNTEAMLGDDWPNAQCALTLTRLPAQSGEVTLAVTCSWGGSSVTKDITLNFTNYGSGPSGVLFKNEDTNENLADTIEMEVGDALNLAGYFTYDNQDYVDMGWLEMDYEGNALTGESDYEVLTVRAVEPGTVETIMTLQYDDYIYHKAFTFVVTEEEPYVQMKLTLPEGTLSIEDEAFRGVKANTVSINDGCESIGDHAFADMQNLEFIRVPSSVTSIADNAFEGSYDPEHPSRLWFDAPEGSYAWTYGEAHGFHVGAGE